MRARGVTARTLIVLGCILIIGGGQASDDAARATVQRVDAGHASAEPLQIKAFHGVEIESVDVFDGDVRDLPEVDPATYKAGEHHPRVVGEVQPPSEPQEPFEDPVWQKQAVPFKSPAGGGMLSAPILNFDGLATGTTPHDPVGDVGPNHYVQAINSVFGIYDKSGTMLAGPTPLDALWPSGVCANGTGDPIVLYDHLADRWMLSQIASPSHLCVAISQTPDPTGAYHLFTVNFNVFPDYPKLALWPDAFYVTINIGADSIVAALERAPLLVGVAPASIPGFLIDGIPGLGFNIIMPGDLDGPLPPAGAGNYFYRQVDGDVFGGVDRVEVFEFADAFGTPTFSIVASVPLSAFDAALCGFLSFSCIPQPGGAAPLLDPLNEPPMWRSQYRNFDTHETLVGSFVVDVDGADTAGVRWFELRKVGAGLWTLFQDGTYAPQDGGIPEHRWISSVAMDGLGNIALGYSVSNSATVFPEIRYTGRVPGDPAGTMPQGEGFIKVGEGVSLSSRWGDYSSMNVDPVDDCTFWYTNDYIDSVDGRQSRIATFRFDGCGDNVCGNEVLEPGEECDPPGSSIPPAHDCCEANGTPGCTDPGCEALVCALYPDCCGVTWDLICATLAVAAGCCDAGVCRDGCCIDSDGDGSCNTADSCPDTPNTAGGSNCCVPSGGLGCTDPACEGEICGFDSFCCDTQWDTVCAGEALRNDACVAGCGASLFVETVLAANKSAFAWPSPQDVVWVRGDLVDLRTVPYGFDVDVTALGATLISAPETPSAGQTLYWVARPDCPLGSWWSGGVGQCGGDTAPLCPNSPITGGVGNRDVFLP